MRPYMLTQCRIKTIAGASRDEKANQLSLLLFQREHGLLTQMEYEEMLDYYESTWAPDCSLDEAMADNGATRFVMREKRTGAIIESYYFRRFR